MSGVDGAKQSLHNFNPSLLESLNLRIHFTPFSHEADPESVPSCHDFIEMMKSPLFAGFRSVKVDVKLSTRDFEEQSRWFHGKLASLVERGTLRLCTHAPGFKHSSPPDLV